MKVQMTMRLAKRTKIRSAHSPPAARALSAARVRERTRILDDEYKNC